MRSRLRPDRRLSLSTVCALALATLHLPGCGVAGAGLGAWASVESRQFAVPLVAGKTVVEVHDTVEGWTERMVVESDGRRATSGVDVEPLDRATEPALDPDRVAFFRDQVGASVDPSLPPLERAVALCDWVSRRTFGLAAGGLKPRRPGAVKSKTRTSEDGRVVLEEIDKGAEFTCLSVATILHDAARAFGLRTRRCDLAVRHESNESHAIVEVWSEPDSHWIVLDPTFNCRFEVDGKPAGVLDLHKAVVERRFSSIHLSRAKDAAGQDPFENDLNPILYYQNLYLHLPSGKWLTRTDDATPAAPVAVTTYLHTDSDEAFRSGGDPLEGVEVRRGALGGHVAFQAVAGMLYVCLADGLFAPSRFQARASSGREIAFLDERPALDAADPLLFASDDLATDEWETTGNPTVSREGSATIVEAASEPAELVMSVDVPPIPIAAFGWIRAERGSATFELRTRREADVSPIWPGASRAVSSRIMTAGRGSADIRITLTAGARCVVERVSIRRALRLKDWT